MKQLGPVLAAYLDERPHSAEVLNDLLEEEGHPRLAEEVPARDRLALVLDEILSVEDAGQLACDFAEHLLSDGPEETEVAARKALAAKRVFLSGEGTRETLVALADEALADWWPNGAPASRTAWAAWAATLARPSQAAACAQAVREGELDWQLRHTSAHLLDKQGA